MSLDYFAIQYVADPLRGEGRNVAVIGTAEGRGYLRTAGLNRDGQIDLAEFRALTGVSVGDSAVVPDWIEYFRCVAAADAHSRESLAQALGALTVSESAFVVGAVGEAEYTPAEGPERAMERVFKRVVAQPPAGQIDRFPERLERLLQLSELRSYPDFWPNAEIELKTDSGMSKVAFDFALTDAPAVGFRIVRWEASRAKTAKALQAALTEFQRAWDCRFLSRMRSVILTDRSWPEGKLSDQLTRATGSVIDVMADDASERLRRLLQRRATGRRV